MFEAIGKATGFGTRRTYSRDLPTDGIWLAGQGSPFLLPAVAIEVAVSESAKALRGSIATLEAVSPALGVIVIQDDEIRRRMLGRGLFEEDVERRLEATKRTARELAATSRQRIEIWDYAQLRYRYRLATGRPSLHTRATRAGELAA